MTADKLHHTVEVSNSSVHRTMPEWLSRHDRPNGSWTVTSGSLQRGAAFTDLVQHRMQVPGGSDPTSRCVRAHEMMHAKVSPVAIWVPDDMKHLESATVVAAEEFRINMLVKAAGFRVDLHLADGSEKRTGERLGESADWNGAVLMASAVGGTRSARPFLSGIRTARPEWSPALRDLLDHLQRLWKTSIRSGTASVASTIPWCEATEGWRFTLRVAEVLQRSLVSEAEVPPSDELRHRVRGTHRGFAPLVLLDLPRTRSADGSLGRRSSPSATGRHLRYPQRLLDDPDRRVFAGRRRTCGGTVLIDQSGSMRLSETDLWRIISAAPGSTVIGYSHHSRSRHQPNIWILAERGRVTDAIPRGNGGNGVDGPALDFAAARHRSGDPFIWVCDGYVTDDHDNFSTSLADHCARLVIRHRVHQVVDVDQAVSALTAAARGARLATRAMGPVAASSQWTSGDRSRRN